MVDALAGYFTADAFTERPYLFLEFEVTSGDGAFLKFGSGRLKDLLLMKGPLLLFDPGTSCIVIPHGTEQLLSELGKLLFSAEAPHGLARVCQSTASVESSISILLPTGSVRFCSGVPAVRQIRPLTMFCFTIVVVLIALTLASVA